MNKIESNIEYKKIQQKFFLKFSLKISLFLRENNIVFVIFLTIFFNFIRKIGSDKETASLTVRIESCLEYLQINRK